MNQCGINLSNEEPQLLEYDWEKEPSYFSPQQLQRFGTEGKGGR